jgi:hypothetical protein
VFKTPAPPGFRAEVLARAHQHQGGRTRRPGLWSSPLACWQWLRAWVVKIGQGHPRVPRPALATTGLYVLVLSTSVIWWASRRGPVPPPLPRAPVLPYEERAFFGHSGVFHGGATQEEPLRAVDLSDPVDMIVQDRVWKASAEEGAQPSRESQVSPIPSSAPRPTGRMSREKPPSVQGPNHLSGRQRSVPGKTKQVKKGLGTRKQEAACGARLPGAPVMVA